MSRRYPVFFSRLGLAVLAIAHMAAPREICGATAEPERRLSCFVSLLPQAFLVERIGGPDVDVHVMVGPGQTPHTFEPTARRLSELSGSQVYFAIGIAFEEPLLKRIRSNFTGVKVVDTSAGIERRRTEDDHVEVGRARSTLSPVHPSPTPGENARGTLDPHVWLSARLAVTIARNIRDAFAQLDSTHSAVYAENCRRLEVELEEADREIARLLGPYKGRAVFVFHPAYGYFTDAYGLRQVAIEKDGRAPGPRHLAEVIEQAKAERVRTIFVQPQVSATHAKTVAKAIGADVVELDPLAVDYVANLLRMGRAIADSFEPGGQ